jgi:hypothetical protein
VTKTTDSVAETARMTKYYRSEYSGIVGRTVIDVRAMYPEEMETCEWDGEPGVVLILDNGGLAVPMTDGDGAGPGRLMIQEGRNA